MKDEHPADYAAYTKSNVAIPDLFDPIVASRLLSRFVGASTISYRQATSSEFSDFASYLNPSYKLPSRGKLTSNIREEADRGKALIKDLLVKAPMVTFNFKVILNDF